MPITSPFPRTAIKRSITHTTNLLSGRAFCTTPPRLSVEPVFSSGADQSKLAAELNLLLKPTGRWSLTDDGSGIERTFRFSTFARAWKFMGVVAEECKSKKHHPKWTNVYNKTTIRWETHKPRGLSSKDTLMARLCDEKAEQSSEVGDEEGQDMKHLSSE